MSDTRRHSYRIYPTEEQNMLLRETIGSARLIYNESLSFAKTLYENGQDYPKYKGFSKHITEMKALDEYAFLKRVDKWALQNAAKDLDTAFENFFSKRAGYPIFKSKHSHRQSYRSTNSGNSIRVEDKTIRLPKVGKIRFRGKMRPFERILNATVTLNPNNTWEISICIETNNIKRAHGDKTIGIDMGIHDFAVVTDGFSFEHYKDPKALRGAERLLIKRQKRLSRMKKGSSNRNKERIKLAKLHKHISAIRKDYLDKLSRKLVEESQTISIETLSPKNMVKNHHLAKHIADASWGMFFHMLEYKARDAGVNLQRVPKFYASSQECHVCGYINKVTKDLKVRHVICPICGAEYDRDENASLNILRAGSIASAQAAGHAVCACGGNVSPKLAMQVEAVLGEAGTPSIARESHEL